MVISKVKRNLLFVLIFYLVAAWPGHAQTITDSITLELSEGEYWWGGLSADGGKMPYSAKSHIVRDLYGNNYGNQSQPLLISCKGRYVWSERPFAYTFQGGKLYVSSHCGKIVRGRHGKTLKEVYTFVSHKFFPSQGKIPDPLLFTRPQYNTWIELNYNQNEDDILQYARSLIDQGYPPGVLMIDDNWQEDYGTWEFSARRFKNPKAMIDQLHAMGFKVMLWICPFVSADSFIFRYLAKEGMLFLDKDKTREILLANTKNKAAIIRWWNGASAMLDLSNPKTQTWFKGELDYLVKKYGVDGFKFDAGDARYYTNDIVSFKSSTPNENTVYYAELGLNYPLNEYRASWKMAGYPLAQRLRDKKHNWTDLKKLIPGILAQGMMGYSFTCPDMIGGGEYQSFLNLKTVDHELIVRSAQVSALMPMMQFSLAPWRVLDKEESEMCREMAILHENMGSKILGLAKRSASTGEPIVKPMAYLWPDKGYEEIKDQFILGDSILVAPVTEKGARSRSVIIPIGKWKGDDDSVVRGPKKIEIEVPINRLPYYIRIN